MGGGFLWIAVTARFISTRQRLFSCVGEFQPIFIFDAFCTITIRIVKTATALIGVQNIRCLRFCRSGSGFCCRLCSCDLGAVTACDKTRR